MQTNNKLRKALVEIIDYLEPIRKWTMPSKENHTKLTALFAAVDTVYAKAKAALAEPVKNCEVGTAEEQLEKWHVFCNQYDADCTDCPCGRNSYSLTYCFAKWAQIPYEEGGAK